MSYCDYLDNREVTFFPSRFESERFGLSVARVTLTNWEKQAEIFYRELSATNVDVVVLRTKNQAANLKELKDEFIAIPAGELTYWASDCDPNFFNPSPLIGYFPARENLQDFLSVISDSFQNYSNHYTYNPLFLGHSARDAYVDWGRSRATSSENDMFAGVLKLNDVPVGAVSGVRAGDDLEIELAGIHSGFQGRGLYAHLIGEFWKSIETQPTSRLVISTQVENVKVQSAWKKLKFTKEFGVYTTHIVRRTLLNKLP
jgi:ribosomal protein S18 acetylase RimI-like enzyme